MNKKNDILVIISGIVLIALAGCICYKQEISENERKQTGSDTTTEEGEWVTFPLIIDEHEKTQSTTEGETATEKNTQQASTTTEKKQNAPLPDNYEWDEKQWGEPPQIVYDFAENQEKFDLIVNEVDALISEEEGFSMGLTKNGLYYHCEHKNIENELSDKFKENATYIFENTKFYNFTKYKSGHWNMDYNQEEDKERYIYYMAYAPEMTEEEAWENGYMKVVGDWYFATLWKI